MTTAGSRELEVIRDVLHGYLECALWASIDGDNDEPFDTRFTLDDFDQGAVYEAIAEIARFVADNLDDCRQCRSWGQVGHDLWLTRNRHGAGFWDRGLGEVGERLTKAAHDLGEAYVFVNGDDGDVTLSIDGC
jgi:hypothetical protein